VLAAGNTKILFATNGALAADIDLGVTIGADSIHDDMDCAWDAVGNVYYIDNWAGRWRALSPPGTNQATTVAVPLIQITPPPPSPPEISSFSISGGNVVIDFTSLNDTSAAAFSVWSAPSAAGPYTRVTNAVVTFIAPGSFEAIAPTNGPEQYYRIRKQL
jgi:hypothetical protein